MALELASTPLGKVREDVEARTVARAVDHAPAPIVVVGSYGRVSKENVYFFVHRRVDKDFGHKGSVDGDVAIFEGRLLRTHIDGYVRVGHKVEDAVVGATKVRLGSGGKGNVRIGANEAMWWRR